MPGLYSHTTRATGTILTATIYNNDHQNHIDNAVPNQHDDYSTNTLQMQTMTDPGEVGTESLATSQAGEIERLRFAIKEMKGTAQWYETGLTSLNGASVGAFKSLFYNGDCSLNQTSQTAGTITGGFFVDGISTANTATARLTTQQSTSNPAPGFPFNLLSTVTTAGAPAAGDFYMHSIGLEGSFIRFLGLGAVGAGSIVLTIKVRSSVAGTYALAVRNAAANRSYVTPLVINAINTWEDKTFVIPGDTSGTWLTAAAAALNISIGMAIGSTYQTASSDVWQAGNFVGLTGQTQLTNTNAAIFQITGIEIAPGTVATPYERIPFDIQLRRARRYWQSNYPYGTPLGSINMSLADAWRAYAISANDIVLVNSGFPVDMMAAPTTTLFHTTTGTASNIRRVNTGAAVALSLGMSSGSRGLYSAQAGGLLVAGELYDFMYASNGRI